ncbi:MAG: glycoprotein endo-alpha-1,2-mannosidase, partial [Bacillariaceae sp.]|jgi:glycoprotein endo-alpha-1,2-mannosidase
VFYSYSDDIYGSVVGSSGNMYPGKERIDSYYFEHQRTWKGVAAEFDCAYIPSVKPGYNDRGVRLDKTKTPLSRRLTPDSPEGSFFDASLERAMQLTDINADNLLMVTSFNEWHEDTQIEPVEIEAETTEPYELTTGLPYVGYGTLYLDMLKNRTTQYDSIPGYSIEYNNVNNNF